jgi:hypothetical protein
MSRSAVAQGITVLVLLLAVAVWLVGLATLPLTLPFPALYHTEPIGEIRGTQTAGQTIVAPYAGLYRVDVSLADYGHQRTGPVYFRLESSPGGAPLVEDQFRAEAIQGDVIQSFVFPPISDSAGKHYYFELAAPEASPGNAITAYIQPGETNPDGEAYFAGQSVPGDLVFALWFKVGGWQRAQIWLEQVSAAKPGPLGQPVLYVLLAVAYVALVAALFWRLRRNFVS